MKKIIISFLSAALVFASCQKEAALVENGSKTVSFTATTPETRTSFTEKDGDSYPVLWTGDENVFVSYNYAAGKSATVTSSDDGKTATFSVAIEQDAEATDHNFYVVCPSAAAISASSTYSSLTIEVPSDQTPVDGSCDESAQIILAKHESDSFDESINFGFQHITAYGNLSITPPSGVSEISSITITAEEAISGRIFYYPADGLISPNSVSCSIALLTGKTEEVFFACLPADLGGTTLKVVIASDDNTYTKKISLPSNFKFVAGRVAKFSVDMSGVPADEKVVYTLVTDPTTLKVGDKVVIAASTADVALGTTQNQNNRAAATITKSGNTVVNPGDGVQIITLEKGTLDNTCAFNVGNSYLYAASSSSNYLRTQETLDENCSFKISYTGGVTSVQAQGTNKRNLLKYNSGNNVFSCYASGQVDVEIYSDGKGTGDQLFSTATVPTPTYASLAELVAAGTPTGGKVNVTLTNEKILRFYESTSNPGTNNGLFLMAGDTEIEIYCNNVPSEWEVGGTLSGTLTECTWTVYNGTWELTPSDWTELTYTAPASSGGDDTPGNAEFSWSTTSITDGYSFTAESAKSASGYYQDKSGTEGLSLLITKTDNTALFTTTPTQISVTVKIGGGSLRDPLNNNVFAYLVDKDGNNIDDTETVVTTKVEVTTGNDYIVTIPNCDSAYGLRITHEKETGYNVRVYSISCVIQ
ncbi:MAG: hypothetical protein ACI399_05590 [Candidatus Cryptobacteroides sp.]